MANFIELGGNDTTLITYFGWAGKAFPYAGTEDITISEDTIWDDVCGYKKVKKLTINAGITLSIHRSPFYLFAEEINFGDTTSCIDASGAPGSSATSWTAKGGGAYATCRGGDGGGMLFIIAGKITGAAGIIKANGGDGYGNGAVPYINGGQGALSSTVSSSFQVWDGSQVVATSNISTYLMPYAQFLGAGGFFYHNTPAAGGGSSASSGAGGGSGIGGGGGAGYSGYEGTNGGVAPITPTPLVLIELAKLGCRGGGGGAAYNNIGASGGGGGSIVVWTHSVEAQPTLQANGGNKTATYCGVGGAGVTHFIVL